MKTLLILRHAKSSWKDEALSDHDRPLNKRGKRDAPRMRELVREKGLTPDLILSSTARRALATAEAAAETCGYDGDVRGLHGLYSFGPEPYLAALIGLPDHCECVMLVGHNPAMEELLEVLTGEYLRFPTAALAHVELPVDHWQDLDEEIEGKLIDLWRPKDL